MKQGSEEKEGEGSLLTIPEFSDECHIKLDREAGERRSLKRTVHREGKGRCDSNEMRKLKNLRLIANL